jgi:hypothetical protein
MANFEVDVTRQVLVTEVSQRVVEVSTPGPQGPPGQGGSEVTELAALSDVDVTGRVAGSVLYYDAGAGEWKGDDINTVVTLTDGGAF